MTSLNRIEDLANATAYDGNGDKLGPVKDVYVNDGTGQPDFVAVKHGLFNLGESIVPLRGHELNDGKLTLAFPKDRIEDSPAFSDSGFVTTENQAEFYRHYGLDDVADTTDYEAAHGESAAGTVQGSRGAGSQYGVFRQTGEPDEANDTER